MANENKNENETVCVPLSKLLVVTEKKPYEGELQPPPFASDWPFLPSEFPGIDVSNASTDITPEMDLKALVMAALRIHRDAKRHVAINTNKGTGTYSSKLLAKNIACAIKSALNASYVGKNLGDLIGDAYYLDNVRNSYIDPSCLSKDERVAKAIEQARGLRLRFIEEIIEAGSKGRM